MYLYVTLPHLRLRLNNYEKTQSKVSFCMRLWLQCKVLYWSLYLLVVSYYTAKNRRSSFEKMDSETLDKYGEKMSEECGEISKLLYGLSRLDIIPLLVRKWFYEISMEWSDLEEDFSIASDGEIRSLMTQIGDAVRNM